MASVLIAKQSGICLLFTANFFCHIKIIFFPLLEARVSILSRIISIVGPEIYNSSVRKVAF